MTQAVENIPKTHCKLILRRSITRLDAILKGESQIIGPKLFGRGVAAPKTPKKTWDPNISQGAKRPHAMELYHGQGVVSANSFKASAPEKTACYRDGR